MTLWSNTATCRPQKPKRRKPGRKFIVSAGFSRRGLDSVDAKVKGDARKDQRKEGNLSTGSGQTTPGQRAVRGTIATQAGSQGIREIRSLVGGAALRLAGSGPARRNLVSPALASWPGSVGSFLLDHVSKSSFTEQPDGVCPGPVAHCRSPQSAGPVKVPCISPPAHPRPVKRVPPVVQ